MKIWISPLREAHNVAARARPASAVSLLSPGDVFPRFEAVDDDEHHKVSLHDIREPQEGRTAPAEDHVLALIAFLKGWNPDETLLVHCWAGISRSTATAFIGACLHNPHADEAAIAGAVADASPTAFPNTRIVSIADDLMGRKGRMAEAVKAICADMQRLTVVSRTDEAEPFHIPSRF